MQGRIQEFVKGGGAQSVDVRPYEGSGVEWGGGGRGGVLR